jgi:HemY protein
MIWIIAKIAVFLAAVAGITLGAEYLLGLDGGVRIAVADVEFTLGPLQAAVAALVLLAALWLLLRIAGLLVAVLRFIRGDATAISRYFEQSRKRRGLEALTEGFLALAAGEGEIAAAKGKKAEKLLENQTLANLLVAQAAQRKGNTALAEERYRQLLGDERARFAAVRGLLAQKIEAGDAEKARKLAEKALGLRPGHTETQETLLSLQYQAADWSAARRTLSEISRSGRLPRDVYRRRDAVLALQQAQSFAAQGRADMAGDLAIEASDLSPALVPAAVMAAQTHVQRANTRAATNVIKRTWKLQPHPELARAFAAIDEGEAPEARLKRFEKLLSLLDHDEARLTRAELLIGAEDFPAARRALGDLAERRLDQRVLTLMAAIERGEGSDDAVVRGWLARALTAPRGPRWICGKCQHIHADWTAICDHCGGFDTLDWAIPPDSAGPSATGTEMLPLIVGKPAAAERPAPDAGEGETIDTNAEIVEAITPAQSPEPAAPPPTAKAEFDLEAARKTGL